MIHNILFRADSSSTIGTGHIMRDLVLASEYAKQGHNIIFAVQELEGNINNKIIEQNFKLHILQSNTVEELIPLIKKNSIDMIVIDHYQIDYNYEKQLKQQSKIKIFCLDDTYQKHYCDILLNHNLGASKSRYNKLVPSHCEIRCGVKYTLIRNEFLKIKERKSFPVKHKNPTNIFIAMGGTDNNNLNINILKVLQKFKNVNINIATTSANRNLDFLKIYTKRKKNIKLHINASNMAELITQCDLAIVSPSVTVNEVLFLKKRFIAIKTIENQNEVFKYLKKQRYNVMKEFNSLHLLKKIKNIGFI